MSNYATKTEFKNATRISTSNIALKSNLIKLKTEVDKIYVEKLITFPVDLRKLSNGVNDEVIKKNVCDKLVAKVNTTDNTGFVFKTKYGTNKSDLGKKTVIKTKKFLILEDLLKKKKQTIMLKLLK